MNALFGTIRELCHGAPSGEATDALVEACEEAYDADPEYACEVVLPYVLPELAGWSDEVVFGEDWREDRIGYGSDIWCEPGVSRRDFTWVMEHAHLVGMLRLEPTAFDYMYRLLARVAYPFQNHDHPMLRLDFDGETFCDRRWPQFGTFRFSNRRIAPADFRESTRPLRLVASMHMVRDDAEGVFDQRLEYIEQHAISGRWNNVALSMPQTVGGPLQPHDGLWPDEVAFLEGCLGHPFAPAVREYLRLFGRLNTLPRTEDFPINPYAWVHCSGSDPVVPIIIENQGMHWLVIRLDKGSDDPRIHETSEGRPTNGSNQFIETLRGLRLPNDHGSAFDCGSFCEVMSGGYMNRWNIPHTEDPESYW